MNGGGESYSGIVPANRSNEGQGGPQEIEEGRPLTKENMGQPNSNRTPSRGNEPNGPTVCGRPRRRFAAIHPR